MKKFVRVLTVFAQVLFVSIVMHAQNNLDENDPNQQVTDMNSANYSLRLKNTDVVEHRTLLSPDFIMNGKPFGYRDRIPPTTPSGLVATALGPNTVNLTFNVSTDNIGIAGYQVYRGGILAGTSLTNAYTDSGLSALTTYTYTVKARDAAGNLSPASASANATTLSTSVNPPRFTVNPYLRSVTNSLAVIEFSTDIASTAIVSYGLTTAYGQSLTLGDFFTSHTATLSGLSAGTLYHYRVSVNDYGANGPTVSVDLTFTTQNTADTVPPVFLDQPMITYLTDTQAIVSFSTNEDATATVFYGRASVSENMTSEGVYAMTHTITLTGLFPNSSYAYRVEIRDRSGNGPVASAEDDFITLTAPDTAAPVIFAGPRAAYVAETSAILEWTTNEPASGIVWYGTVSGTYAMNASSIDVVTDHSVTLTNLIANTTYYYVVQSTDPAGNASALSAQASFRTARRLDTTPPRLLRMSEVFSEVSATVHWETNEIADGKVVFGTASGSYTQQVFIPDYILVHDLDLTGLLPSTLYYYQVLSSDPSGNQVIGAERSFRTLAPGTVSALTLTTITDKLTANRIVITWITNNPGTGVLYYRKSTDTSWQTVENTRNLTAHTLRINRAGLASGTYYYRVYTKDVFNQELEKSADDFGVTLGFVIP
jgi:phosphodiesterase/alkaline phosphatase D-like protein